MLLLKRILASLIDLIFFAGMVFANGWILSETGVWDGQYDFPLPLLLSFVCSVIVPILLYTKTLGEKLVGVKYKNSGSKQLKVSLLIKYVILYCFLTLNTINIIQFLGNLLQTYTYVQLSISLVLRINIAFIFTNTFMLLVTIGRSSLLDRMLAIQVDFPSNARRRFSALSAAYVFAVLMIIGIGIDRKFRDYFRLDEMERAAYSTLNELRFPIEEFDNFTLPGEVYYRVIKTNFIVTPSDINSFVDNKYLYQRQIQANIKSSLLNDAKKRADLCGSLIRYCYGIVDLQDTNALVMQTKIELTHIKYYTPFFALVSNYIYYYEDKDSRYGLYGGYSPDSLNKYYFQTRRNCIDTLCKYLSRRTSIPVSIAASHFAKGDALEFIRSLPAKVKSGFDSIDLSPMIDKRLTTLRPITFDSVKRVGRLTFMYPKVMYQIFGDGFYETQFMGAMYFKNNHFGLMQPFE